jgi:hypothetical protein
MSMVKVWNDNIYPHSEKFKGKDVDIPAGAFIEMDYDDAKQFQGQYKPPKMNGQGHDPRGFKKIRVENPPAAKVDPLMNHANGAVANNPAELKAMAKEFAHMAVKEENENENRLRQTKEEHAAVMSDVKNLIGDMRGELDNLKKENGELKDLMGSAPFNLSKEEIATMKDNKKGGGKNANGSNNAKG